eukprot:scaffold2782_cov78-Skeletonema_dohrnii-CCMP3373.AAC.9
MVVWVGKVWQCRREMPACCELVGWRMEVGDSDNISNIRHSNLSSNAVLKLSRRKAEAYHANPLRNVVITKKCGTQSVMKKCEKQRRTMRTL